MLRPVDRHRRFISCSNASQNCFSKLSKTLWIILKKPYWIVALLASYYYLNIVSCSACTPASIYLTALSPTATKEGNIIIDFGHQGTEFPSGVRRFQKIKAFSARVVTETASILSWAKTRPVRRTEDNIAAISHSPLIMRRVIASIGHINNETVQQVGSSAATSIAASEDNSYGRQQIYVSADLASFIRIACVIAKVSASASTAFVGTLRLLAPMIVARRAVLSLSEVILDYMRGRYFRSTYSRLERAYLRYYEAPAALRAMARSLSQILIFFWLSMMMSWLTGIATSGSFSDSVSFLEGLLWISSVIGSGHAFTQYVAYWGGPLRIQRQFHEQEYTERTILQHIFVQPFHIIQFMQDPAQWINLLSIPSQTKQQQTTFDPNPLIFPITWGPLRILQMFALANILCTSTTATIRKELMRHFLIQLALGDEWCRVLLEEKRIGLGIVTVLCYMCSLLFFLKLAFSVNPARSYWLLPSLIACLVSGWMNIVIFWNRIEGKQKDAFEARMRNAFMKALTLKPPVY
jgi:tryptophan-rich sensory protein